MRKFTLNEKSRIPGKINLRFMHDENHSESIDLTLSELFQLKMLLDKKFTSTNTESAKCPKCGNDSCYVVCSDDNGGCGDYAESVSGHIACFYVICSESICDYCEKKDGDCNCFQPGCFRGRKLSHVF